MDGTHVFVETSWVFQTCAPPHLRIPDAIDLLEKARAGALTVHVPAICLTEGRNAIRAKHQPRNQVTPLRKYIRWSTAEHKVQDATAETVRLLLEQYEQFVTAELDNLERTVGDLVKVQGVKAFPLSESMLERALSLSIEKLELHPFDNAILAAILTRAEEIKAEDANNELFFCALDSDLQPWDKNGNMKPVLTRLYDDAQVWVYGDFGMRSHERPTGWPK